MTSSFLLARRVVQAAANAILRWPRLAAAAKSLLSRTPRIAQGLRSLRGVVDETSVPTPIVPSLSRCVQAPSVSSQIVPSDRLSSDAQQIFQDLRRLIAKQ